MAQAAPAPQPTAYGVPANFVHRHRFSLELDTDIALLCEDQATQSGMTLQNWLQHHANEGLRLQLFG